MEPIPGWARAWGIAVAALAAPLLVLLVIASVMTAATTIATVHRTASYTVGDSPRLTLDVQPATVVVESGSPGLITIDDQHSASTITRAGAGAAVSRMSLSTTQRGDELRVRESSPLFEAATTQRSAILRVRVPPHTDLDLTTLGDVEIQGVDARVHVGGGAGDVTLRDVTLRGDSTIGEALGDVRLERTTVAGSLSITSRAGQVRFDGTLAPGGSSLTVLGGTGDVSITLPRPTDARAVVATQLGDLHADPAWHFVPDQLGASHRWSADLGPNPTGSLTVGTSVGTISFGVR